MFLRVGKVIAPKAISGHDRTPLKKHSDTAEDAVLLLYRRSMSAL